MAVGAGSPVSRGLARSTAPLERQGRAALEEDTAEESLAPGGEQVERGGGRTPPPWRVRGAVQHVRERQLGQAEDTAPSSKSLLIGDRCPTSASYEPSTRRMELARLCRQIHWSGL